MVSTPPPTRDSGCARAALAAAIKSSGVLLFTTTLIYAIGAGITAAAGTRLALDHYYTNAISNHRNILTDALLT